MAQNGNASQTIVETSGTNSFTVHWKPLWRRRASCFFFFVSAACGRVRTNTPPCCCWIDHWLHPIQPLVRSLGLVPPICEQLLSQVGEKNPFQIFFSPSPLPPSSSASSAAWAQRPGCDFLSAMWRREPLILLIPGRLGMQ